MQLITCLGEEGVKELHIPKMEMLTKAASKVPRHNGTHCVSIWRLPTHTLALHYRKRCCRFFFFDFFFSSKKPLSAAELQSHHRQMKSLVYISFHLSLSAVSDVHSAPSSTDATPPRQLASPRFLFFVYCLFPSFYLFLLLSQQYTAHNKSSPPLPLLFFFVFKSPPTSKKKQNLNAKALRRTQNGLIVVHVVAFFQHE